MFFEVLYALLPQDKYMPLFREVLADVWKQKNHEREQARIQIDKKIMVLKAKKQKLIDLVAEDILSGSRAKPN
jgi:hypothetical protein